MDAMDCDMMPNQNQNRKNKRQLEDDSIENKRSCRDELILDYGKIITLYQYIRGNFDKIFGNINIDDLENELRNLDYQLEQYSTKHYNLPRDDPYIVEYCEKHDEIKMKIKLYYAYKQELYEINATNIPHPLTHYLSKTNQCRGINNNCMNQYLNRWYAVFTIFSTNIHRHRCIIHIFKKHSSQMTPNELNEFWNTCDKNNIVFKKFVEFTQIDKLFESRDIYSSRVANESIFKLFDFCLNYIENNPSCTFSEVVAKWNLSVF